MELGNKTIEQVTVTDVKKPKPFNKNILLLGGIVFATFLAIILIVFKIRKGKKKDPLEKLREEINAEKMKPKDF